MFNTICKLAYATVLLSLTAAAAANPSAVNTTTLLYIQPLEYNHPIALWNYSYKHWFYQGPVVEKLALEKFSAKLGSVKMCESNQSGQMLVWLQPKMFYNPQLQLFYGTLVANVYTGLGKLIASYEGSAHASGLLGLYADHAIEKSYALAMDNMLAKMQADTRFPTAHQADMSDETTPCSMVTLLPAPKIRATSF